MNFKDLYSGGECKRNDFGGFWFQRFTTATCFLYNGEFLLPQVHGTYSGEVGWRCRPAWYQLDYPEVRSPGGKVVSGRFDGG